MEIQPKNMTDDEKELCRKAISEYKQIRPIVQFGNIYRLVSPYDRKGLASLMYVTDQQDKADKEATNGGMTSLLSNSSIISKINVPKYLFLLSKNVSALMNFGLTLIVYFIFCIIDHIKFGWHFFMLFYPIICLILLNIGVGMILSNP